MNINITKTKNSKLSTVNFSNIQFGNIFSDHMLIMKFSEGEWKAPEIKPFEEILFSPAMSGIHYGQSVFEGIKARKNPKTKEISIFRLEDHYNRFINSSTRLCIPHVPKFIFLEGIKKLVDLDRDWVKDTDAYSLYIRPVVFASEIFLGVRAAKEYYFIVMTCPVGKLYSKPLKVKIETNYTRAANGGVGYAKAAGNYGASVYPDFLAQKEGFNLILWTDAKEHRFVEEIGSMNIAFVIKNTLVTPKVGKTILDGITRRSLLSIANDLNIKYEERLIEINELFENHEKGKLEEAFGIGTAAIITFIESFTLDKKTISLKTNQKDSIGSKLLEKYNNIVYGIDEDKHKWLTIV